MLMFTNIITFYAKKVGYDHIFIPNGSRIIWWNIANFDPGLTWARVENLSSLVMKMII